MKNSLRKIFSIVLCAVMLVSVGIISVSAENVAVMTDCNGECEFYPTIIVPGLGQSNTWLADEG